jgi:hypothetical protein
MTDISKKDEAIAPVEAASVNGMVQTPSRRQLLKIGAVAAPAALTLRPGHAWAASFNCSVRIPYIFQNTTTGDITPVLPIDSEPGPAPAGTVLVAPPRLNGGRFYLGNEILATGTTIPDAHVRYLGTVTAGNGLTCLQSIGFTR